MITQALKRYKNNPIAFVKEILRVTPDEWQAEALNALANNSRTAVRSGHGVGKTAFESWAVNWFLFTRPYCKVVCTAPTVRQLYDILWSEISKWLKRTPILSDMFEWQKTKVICKVAPERWFAAARTAARPENMQGFHDEHLLFILDEASGIEDAIFEAVEGALTGKDNKLLMCGNPTRNTGFFKRAFFEDRDMYYTMKVSSAESARVSDDYCKRLIRAYGEDSDVVRVRVHGEFPKGENDSLIPLELVEAAMERKAEYKGELILGVDVARQGSDLTVVAVRVGDSLVSLGKWQHADLMTTCGKISSTLSNAMKKYNCARATIRVDDDGIGAGVTDRLREVIREKNLRVTVIPCHNGGRSTDNRYANFVTQCYFAIRDRLQSGEITLPKDDLLAAELSTRKFSLNSSDKVILERKEEFKKRLGRSPDRADAVALAFAPLAAQIKIPEFPMTQSYWLR